MRKSRDWMLNFPPGLGAPARRFVWRDPSIDVLIDSYVEWREECDTVQLAYERWSEAERPDRALGYASYRAALDREEKAAAVYRLAATRLAGVVHERLST